MNNPSTKHKNNQPNTKMIATDILYKHKYNPNGPVAYFLTFHSYGTWLHGDDRGSIGKKQNIPGTPMIAPNKALYKFETEQLKQPPVTFSKGQRESIDSIIRKVCEYKKWNLHAVNVRTEHVHVVVSSSISADLTETSLKSWCTRKLRDQQLWSSKYSPWSHHGSTRYVWNDEELKKVIKYVLYRQD